MTIKSWDIQGCIKATTPDQAVKKLLDNII